MPKPTPPGGRIDLLHLGRPAGGCGCGGQCGCGGGSHDQDNGTERPVADLTVEASES